MNLKTHLSIRDCETFIEDQLELGLTATYNFLKHQIIFENDLKEQVSQLWLPISKDYTNGQLNTTNDYALILIRSDSATIGFVEDNELVQHKVITAYMTRRKQGKSQLNHLKTKGKSRAGSRVRLANTLHFFNSINEYLQDHMPLYLIDRIAISCPKMLQPYFFNAEIETPFSKNDERLYSIPFHVDTPNFKNLKHIHFLVSYGHTLK